MPHIDLGDLKYYYEIHGEGAEAITILNGLTMSTVSWAAQVRDFSPHFRVLLLDMRGQGQTDRTDEEKYPLPRQADDLARLLEKLGIARTHVFALSYGGIVAQYFALQYPDRLGRLVSRTPWPGPTRSLAPSMTPLSWRGRRAARACVFGSCCRSPSAPTS